MAYYNTCPVCGCSLDPGEKCDCEQEVHRKEQERQKMIFVGSNGQMAFAFTKEAKFFEKEVV